MTKNRIRAATIIALSILSSAGAFAQSYIRVDPNPVFTIQGNAPQGGRSPVFAVPGSSISIYTDPATTTKATTYSGVSGAPCPLFQQVVLSNASSCISTTDQQGNFGFWLAASPTYYWYTVTFPNSSSINGPFPISVAPLTPTPPPPLPLNYLRPFTSVVPNSQSIGSGSNTVVLTTCPVGVNPNDIGHYVYLTGQGVPEVVLITGGAGSAGSACSLNFTNIYPHGVGFAIQSATAGLQEAVNAFPAGSHIILPAEAITMLAGVSYLPNSWISGATGGGTVITNTNDLMYAFSYHSPVLTIQNQLNLTSRFEEFTLNTKYGIQANSDDPSVMQFQALLLSGPYIEHVIFNGLYGGVGRPNVITDPDSHTAILPTETYLKTFGVAIQINKTFETYIHENQLNAFGIAIDANGCDLGKADHNRYTNNGRHAQLNFYSDHAGDASDFLGSSFKITNSDVLGNQRIGGIYLNAAHFTYIENNYYEEFSDFTGSAPTKGMILITDNDFGTQFKGNRLDSFGLASTNVPSPIPAVSFDSNYSTLIEGNVYNPRAQNPPYYCGTTYVNGTSHPIIYTFVGNDQISPICDSPHALVGQINPYLITYNNLPGIFFGSAGVTSPFIISPVTGLYATKTSPVGLAIRMPVTTAISRNLMLTVTARSVTAAGFMTITYTDDQTATTTILSGNVGQGFTDTLHDQTRQVPLTLPSTATGSNGSLEFDLANDQAEYSSIRITPVANGGFPFNGQFPLSGGITAASTIAPIVPYFYLGGSNGTNISNITVPPNFQSGQICAIPTVNLTTDTSGNIGAASAIVPNQTICWWLDPFGPKWYPTYTGVGFSGSKTFGSCTVSMLNGLITAVTGC